MVLIEMGTRAWHIIAVRGAPTTLTVEGVRVFSINRWKYCVLSHITRNVNPLLERPPNSATATHKFWIRTESWVWG
jgi:hypothetical protein